MVLVNKEEGSKTDSQRSGGGRDRLIGHGKNFSL